MVPASADSTPCVAALAHPVIDRQVKPGKLVSGVVKRDARIGEFAFCIAVGRDGPKHVVIRLRRPGSKAFVVLDTTKPNGATCEGAAGTLYCSDITTPAVPTPGRFIITATNAGSRTAHVRVAVIWRRIYAAG